MEKVGEIKRGRGTGRRQRKKERGGVPVISETSVAHGPMDSPKSKKRKRSNSNTSKCPPTDSSVNNAPASAIHAAIKQIIAKSERKGKLTTSPQRAPNSEDAIAKKIAAKECTSTTKPLSKFRIPKKAKSTDQPAEEPNEHTDKCGRATRASKHKRPNEEATLEEEKTLESKEAAVGVRTKHVTTDKNTSSVNLHERKSLKSEMIAIPKQNHRIVPIYYQQKSTSTPEVKTPVLLTSTFPVVVKGSQNLSDFAVRMPNPLESSISDRNMACKMFAPVNMKLENLSTQSTDNNYDEAMDMDWDNQVPEIRRLWDEISVLPLTGNTEDDMEVDPTDILILVPDTNIWIGCVNLLKQLLNTDFPKVGYPTIVIPWMVLQELDVKSKVPNSKSARHSVKFIHELLSSKHPRVRGQRASDAALSQMKFDDIVADDSILQCAFQLQRTDTTVVFLSNDRNLCNKALVHGLITFDAQDAVSKITKMLTKDSPGVPELINNTPTACVDKHINNYTECNVTPLNFQSNDSFTSNYTTFSPKSIAASPSNDSITTSNLNRRNLLMDPGKQAGPFQEVLDSLRNAITCIIITKMKEDYGDGWKHAVKIQPPWTLLSGVKCMILHWIAVFSFIFGSKGKSGAEELLELVKRYENSGKQQQQMEIDIVECAIGLFTLGKSSDIMQHPLVINCQQMLMIKLSGGGGNMQLTEATPTLRLIFIFDFRFASLRVLRLQRNNLNPGCAGDSYQA